MENNMEMKINAYLSNVATVRVAISSFISNLDITLDETIDIKTAVSEAVTNSVEHAYKEESQDNYVLINSKIDSEKELIKIEVIDYGIGIEDVGLAMTPEYTTKSEDEHTGMGFTIMESFMDEVIVDSGKDKGTKITLTKKIKRKSL